jgi:protein-tyrosine phosphatase
VIHEAMRTGRFASLPDVETVNLAILSEDTINLAAFIRIVGRPEHLPLIFHCIGGKDRTGIAAALLLSILGVPWATVREDYVRSNEQIADAIDAELEGLARAAAERSGRDPEPVDLTAARRFATVEGSDLDAVRDQMIADAGSIEGYVHDRLGISQEIVQSLRHQLLE